MDPINPLESALGLGATFVARTYSGDIKHFKATLKAAVAHKGYAIVDVMQTCISFNKINTHQWYKERITHIDETHDTSDKAVAYLLAQQFGDEGVPLGIFYQDESKPTYMERLIQVDEPLVTYERDDQMIKDIIKSFI